MAIGAYSSIILTVDVGLPFCLSLPLSAGITILAALIIGLSSLRLRADYFSIATIAFAEIIRDVAQNARDLTGGNQGTIDVELANDNGFYTDTWYDVSDWIQANILDPIGLSDSQFSDLPLFLVVWVMLGLLAFGLNRLIRSPWGRVLRAVREDEDAARALGKNAFSYKLQSLSIAAVLGAVSGLVPRDQPRVGHPGVVRAALHLPRLCDPRPRRAGELRRGVARLGHPVDRCSRACALPTCRSPRTRTRRCASSSSG